MTRVNRSSKVQTPQLPESNDTSKSSKSKSNATAGSSDLQARNSGGNAAAPANKNKTPVAVKGAQSRSSSEGSLDIKPKRLSDIGLIFVGNTRHNDADENLITVVPGPSGATPGAGPSAAAAAATSAGPTPVGNPQTGNFDWANMNAAITAMRKAIPSTATLPAHATKAQAAFTKIQMELHHLHEKVAKAPTDAASQATLGKDIHETFQRLQDTAETAAKDLRSGGPFRPTPTASQPHWKGLARNLSGAFRELKRNALALAAPHLMEQYAARETANLEKVAPGYEKGAKAGAIVIETKRATVGFGALGGVAASFGHTKLRLRDDDKAVLQMNMPRAGVGVTLGVGPASLVVSGSHGAGRRVLVDGEAKNVVKLDTVADANKLLQEKLLAHSASPGAEKIRMVLDNVKTAARFLTGRTYAPETGAPTYLSDAKLAKGYTTTRLNLYAQAADKHVKALNGDTTAAPGPWSQMVSTFYPSVPALAKQAQQDGTPLPTSTALDRTSPAPLASGRGLAHYQDPSARLTAGGGLTGPALMDDAMKPMQTGLKASGSLGYDLLRVQVAATKYAHELLDPSTFKDMGQVFKLTEQYDAQAAKNPPGLRMYNVVKGLLGNEDGGPAVAAAALAPHATHFGPTPPAQFHQAIVNPSADGLKAAQDIFDLVNHSAHMLAELGEVLMAKPDGHEPPAIRKELDDLRSAAFKMLNAEVWDADYNAGGRLKASGYPAPKGTDAEKAALDNPQKFLAESHDALSKAVGLAGVHLQIHKMQLTKVEIADGGLTAGTYGAMKNADDAYAGVRELMDKTFLAIKKKNITDQSTVDSHGLFQRHHLTAGFALSGPATTDPLPSMGMPASVPLTIANGVTVSLSGQAQAQWAQYQPIAPRVGQNLEATINLQSGVPLTGELLGRAVNKAVELMGNGIKTDSIDTDGLDQKLLQVAGAGVNTRLGGSTVVVGIRHPTGTELTNARMSYLRVMTSSTGGADATVGINGLVASAGGTAEELIRGARLEILGADLGYLSMQNAQLMEGMAKADQRLKAAGNPNPDVPAKAAAAFQAEPHLKNMYFGDGKMIFNILDQQRKALHAIKNNALPPDGAKVPNEFFTFYTQEPFITTRRRAGEVDQHAPGSITKGVDPRAPAERLNTVRHMDVSDAQWQAIKTQVEALKTVDAREQFFTTHPVGQTMLSTFVDAVDNVTKTWIATAHHAEDRKFGFQAKVKDERGAVTGKGKAPEDGVGGETPAPGNGGNGGGPLGILKNTLFALRGKGNGNGDGDS